MNKKKIGAIALSIAIAAGSGYGIYDTWIKEMPCSEEEPHSHIYVGPDGFRRYIASHKNWLGLLNYREEIGPFNAEVRGADKEDLYPVGLNEAVIEKQIAGNPDFVEYFCTYDHYEKVGTKTVTTFKRVKDKDGDYNWKLVTEKIDDNQWVSGKETWTAGIKKNWSSDYKNVVYTGKARNVNHLCIGYIYDSRLDGVSNFVEYSYVEVSEILKYDYVKSKFIYKVWGPEYYIELDEPAKKFELK